MTAEQSEVGKIAVLFGAGFAEPLKSVQEKHYTIGTKA